jgi:hypothetical protein
LDNIEQIRQFFNEYAARFNRALQDPPVEDVEASAGAFADCFIGASPAGVRCGNNDEQFRTVIPQGNAFYRSIGTRSMQITRLEITPLDDIHAMARVYWDSHYSKKTGEDVQIQFEVIYLLQILAGRPKVFGYITGDEQKLLKEHGLLPE